MNRYFYRILIFILAICSIVYELILANTLAIITDSYILWHSLTIGIYILGLGIGSAKADKIEHNLQKFIQVELNLSILGVISSSYIYILYGLFSMNDFLIYIHNGFYTQQYLALSKFFVILFGLFSQSVTFLIGMYSGYEIPLGTTLDQQLTSTKTNENTILSINYIGTLCGTLLFAFVFFTKLDVLITSYTIASINFLIVIVLLFKARKVTTSTIIKILTFVSLLIYIAPRKEWIEQFYLKTNYLADYYIARKGVTLANIFTKAKEIPHVTRYRTRYQYIDVYKTFVPHQKKLATVLALNTHFQFSTHNEKFYHEAMAHLPINLLQINPKKVLVLGGGDGLLLRELLKYPGMNITHIELDEQMLHLCKTAPWIKALNQGSLEDPRIKRIIGDGFYYLRNTKEKYDIIFIDFPYPDNYNLVKLYTYEFYSYVRKALTPKGITVLDAPMVNKVDYYKAQYIGKPILSSQFDKEDEMYNSILYNTFYKAGFKFVFPYKIRKESFVILSSTTQTLNFNFNKFDHTKIPELTAQDLYDLQEQEFPYHPGEEFVNSLFRPTFLQVVGN